MLLKVKYLLLLFVVGLVSTSSFTQTFNYQGIDVQGQIVNADGSTISLNFQIISLGGVTIWEENHDDVALYDQNTYQLTLGQGAYVGGTISAFENLNWFDVDRVEVRRTDAGPAYLVGTYNLLPVPYSFHSLTCLDIPFTFDLSDGISSSPDLDYVLRFDGTQFFIEEEWLGDTALFAYYSGTTAYADTVDFAYAPNEADSAELAFEADSAGYALMVDSTIYADTAFYGDTSSVALVALNNWRIDGNAGTSGLNYAGTSNAENFNLGTNGSFRLRFGTTGNIFQGTEYPGVSFDSNEGALYTLSNVPGLSNISASFLYFGGTQRGFFGGETPYDLDTAMSEYCMVWGRDNATNGINSTIFGYGNIGDSTQNGATTYPAISSFAVGRGNQVSRMGVAMGDSCVADYYRSVAIGRKAIATNLSATTAIGWNVLATGATSWGFGQNITASGNYSTVVGTNASSNGFTGTFVYGDFSTSDTVKSTAAHQFMARASGGFIFYSSSDLSTGVELAPGGGSWLVISDRNVKRNIIRLNPGRIRSSIALLPISKWTYKGQKENHIGPMAQDFYSSFQLGEDNRHINMIDFHGVTFAGIKELNQRVNEADVSEEVKEIEQEIQQEKEELQELEKRIEELRNRLEEDGENTEVIEK